MWCFGVGLQCNGQFMVVYGCDWCGIEWYYFVGVCGGYVEGDVVDVEVVGVVGGQFDFDVGVGQVEVFYQ